MVIIRRYWRELLSLAGAAVYIVAGRMGAAVLLLINGALALVTLWLLFDPWRLVSVVLIRKERMMLAAAIVLDAAALQIPGLHISARLAALMVSLLLLLIWLRWRSAWRQRAAFKQSAKVDQTLEHYTHQGEWEAGNAWTNGGRAETAAFIRQGLNRLVEERVLDEVLRPAYQIGHMTGAGTNRRAMDKLKHRCIELERKNEMAMQSVAALQERLEDVTEQSERVQELEALSTRQQNRIAQLMRELETLRPQELPEPEAEPVDRDAELVRLHEEEGVSYGDLAARFDMTRSAVISAIRRRKAAMAAEEEHEQEVS